MSLSTTLAAASTNKHTTFFVSSACFLLNPQWATDHMRRPTIMYFRFQLLLAQTPYFLQPRELTTFHSDIVHSLGSIPADQDTAARLVEGVLNPPDYLYNGTHVTMDITWAVDVIGVEHFSSDYAARKSPNEMHKQGPPSRVIPETPGAYGNTPITPTPAPATARRAVRTETDTQNATQVQLPGGLSRSNSSEGESQDSPLAKKARAEKTEKMRANNDTSFQPEATSTPAKHCYDFETGEGRKIGELRPEEALPAQLELLKERLFETIYTLDGKWKQAQQDADDYNERLGAYMYLQDGQGRHQQNSASNAPATAATIAVATATAATSTQPQPYSFFFGPAPRPDPATGELSVEVLERINPQYNAEQDSMPHMVHRLRHPPESTLKDSSDAGSGCKADHRRIRPFTNIPAAQIPHINIL
ncbi:uncharacterized protein EI97DRAFT_497548 [Westerdykella ornata]|uniref:Uncharacterized protein n=1 Tax=Westerdykella ornata TaxID=318751 RepID=A0A6A6JYG8_WESOR|nr:uncharacterized protein EI97DRAFT_497548 [Westerdykella ornata]KAF2280796.1 hypothetical protein EI97DRAFT_497548 [Westerdykella ornata]